MKKHKKKKTRMAVNSTAAKKEYKHSLKLGTKMVIIIVILLIALVLIFVSGLFNISEIIVENNSSLSTEQIISFSGIEKGKNLFTISKGDTIDKIMENPYIDSVQIKKVLPDKIKLVVSERKVEYGIQFANSYIYIDKQGYILEISNNKPQVPIIVGIKTDLSNIKINDKLVDEDLQKMNIVAKIMETASDNDLTNLISRIDVSNKNDYTIYLDTENKIAYLGKGTELNTRFLYIKKLLEIHKEQCGEIIVNGDLNTEYVYFREKVEE